MSKTDYKPKRMIDAHHHFLDTTTADGNAKTFQAFLASLLPEFQYLPKDYHKDVVVPLLEAGITLTSSVHVECMPDDGKAEAEWLFDLMRMNSSTKQQGKDEEEGKCTVKAIVASADLASDKIEEDLAKLMSGGGSSEQINNAIKGIRWIIDCVGKFQPNTATHIATTRGYDGIDYLRGSNGPDTYDGDVVESFEKGFALLERYNLSFDLQCAPVQLRNAAKLCQRYPNVKVVIDHLGKPRTLLGPDCITTDDNDNNNTKINPNIIPNADELEIWRHGMKAMAKAHSNVYVKLSMMGYAVPGWMKTPERREFLKSLVQEVIEMFTPQRCMACLNWWKDGSTSDSDFLSDVGPSPIEYVEFISECLQDDEKYTKEDKDRIFYGTAAEFYGIKD